MKKNSKDTFKKLTAKGWIKRIEGVNVYVGPATGKNRKTFAPTGELMAVSCNEHGIVSAEKVADLPLVKRKPRKSSPRAWTGVIRDGKIRDLKRVKYCEDDIETYSREAKERDGE